MRRNGKRVRLNYSTVCPRSSGPFYVVTYNIKWVTTSWTHSTTHTTVSTVCPRSSNPFQIVSYIKLSTVCPGSSDPPEKMLNIFASENEVYNIF